MSLLPEENIAENPTAEEQKTLSDEFMPIDKASLTAQRAFYRARRIRRNNMLFVTALILYISLAVLAYFFNYFAWDKKIEDAIQRTTIPGFHPAMISLSLLGDRWIPFALVIVVSLMLVLYKKRLEAIVCLCGVGLGAALNAITKVIVARPRPDQSLVQVIAQYNHDSFPSGHTFFFVEFFGFLFFILYITPLRRRAVRQAFLTSLAVLIAFIGISRVYMGAHWPSDVIGGYLAGTLWLALMIKTYERLKARQNTANVNSNQSVVKE
jgi:membrane-associated phospholipid phosphatase